MNPPKAILLLLISLLVSSSCISIEKSNEELKVNRTTEFQGTYSFGKDIEKEAVGTLKIHKIDNKTALFYLDVCRGAPSYNSGRLYGKINIKGNKGTYTASGDDSSIECELNFTFSEKQVEVTSTLGKDQCGFGHAVYADHIYLLQNHKQPESFINGEGKTLYFHDSNESTEKISYVKFNPEELEKIELDGFDIEEALQIDSNIIVIAYSPGDLETSETPSNWGDGLMLLRGDSILYQSKRVGDPYQYEPFFYRNTSNSKVIIICQLGNEENYGGEAFLLENGTIEFIGEIKIESPHETPDNTSLIEIIRVSEIDSAIYFHFDSDTLIDLTNEEWNRVKNNDIHYVFKEHRLTLKGL